MNRPDIVEIMEMEKFFKLADIPERLHINGAVYNNPRKVIFENIDLLKLDPKKGGLVDIIAITRWEMLTAIKAELVKRNNEGTGILKS